MTSSVDPTPDQIAVGVQLARRHHRGTPSRRPTIPAQHSPAGQPDPLHVRSDRETTRLIAVARAQAVFLLGTAGLRALHGADQWSRHATMATAVGRPTGGTEAARVLLVAEIVIAAAIGVTGAHGLLALGSASAAVVVAACTVPVAGRRRPPHL